MSTAEFNDEDSHDLASEPDLAAEEYARTHDTSEFEGGEFVATRGKSGDARVTPRSSIFSVRFTSEELDVVVNAAAKAGVKPGTFIRQSSVQAAGAALADNRDDDEKVLDLVAALRRSVEDAKRHRAEQAADQKTTG